MMIHLNKVRQILKLIKLNKKILKKRHNKVTSKKLNRLFKTKSLLKILQLKLPKMKCSKQFTKLWMFHQKVWLGNLFLTLIKLFNCKIRFHKKIMMIKPTKFKKKCFKLSRTNLFLTCMIWVLLFKYKNKNLNQNLKLNNHL